MLDEQWEDIVEYVIGHENISDYEDILKHHGILGMKWGVRRPVGNDGLVKGTSSGYRRAAEMSTKDLAEATKRMQLEQQYDRLVQNTIPKSAAKSIAEKVIAKLGEQTANEVSKIVFSIGKKKTTAFLAKFNTLPLKEVADLLKT